MDGRHQQNRPGPRSVIVNERSHQSSELVALPGLAELPSVADTVASSQRAAIACCDHERQGTAQLRLHRPQRAPVAVHRVPPSVSCANLHCPDVAGSTYVVNQHHQEPRVATDSEPDSTALRALHPTQTPQTNASDTRNTSWNHSFMSK